MTQHTVAYGRAHSEAAAMVPIQTYPLAADDQESVCQLCQQGRRGEPLTVNAWIREHRIEHLKAALEAIGGL